MAIIDVVLTVFFFVAFLHYFSFSILLVSRQIPGSILRSFVCLPPNPSLVIANKQKSAK
jgi:hypothetical protein